MNIPGTVYSWPLSSEKCICHRSSRPGDEWTVFIASGWPPLRVPLFMMATRGCSACTSTWNSSSPARDATREDIHRADAVVRAHQLEFLVPGQIAEMHRAELSERDVLPTDCAFSALLSPGLEAGAVRIRLAGARAAAS